MAYQSECVRHIPRDYLIGLCAKNCFEIWKKKKNQQINYPVNEINKFYFRFRENLSKIDYKKKTHHDQDRWQAEGFV